MARVVRFQVRVSAGRGFLFIIWLSLVSPFVQPAVLSISNQQGFPGSEVALLVKVLDGEEITAAQLTLEYDPAVLLLKNVSKGSLLTDHNLYSGQAPPGTLRLALASLSLSTLGSAQGELLALEFQIVDPAVAGLTQLELSAAKVASASGNRIPVELSTGYVEILPARCHGDLNSDLKRDVSDLVLVLGHILGREEISGPDFSAADLNDDGRVDVLDFVLLLGGVLGREELETCP